MLIAKQEKVATLGTASVSIVWTIAVIFSGLEFMALVFGRNHHSGTVSRWASLLQIFWSRSQLQMKDYQLKVHILQVVSFRKCGKRQRFQKGLLFKALHILGMDLEILLLQMLYCSTPTKTNSYNFQTRDNLTLDQHLPSEVSNALGYNVIDWNRNLNLPTTMNCPAPPVPFPRRFPTPPSLG